jgi:hypothetical protein
MTTKTSIRNQPAVSQSRISIWLGEPGEEKKDGEASSASVYLSVALRLEIMIRLFP